jgi:hypothetical protein
MALDLTNIIKIYQDNIDDLIKQLGKPVVLHFYETITNVNDEFNDPVRPGDIRKPDYTQTQESTAPNVSENTKTIKALIQYKPKEFDKQAIDLGINDPRGTIRLKTLLTDVPDLVRCQFIVPNADSQNILKSEYKLVGQPIPVGLAKDRYAVSYWSIL